MWETILNVTLSILTITFAFLTYYLDVRRKLQEKLNGEINTAEDTGEIGIIKMSYVVDTLYSIVPMVLRPIFTKKMLEKMVQKAFDEVEEYAAKQIEKSN